MSHIDEITPGLEHEVAFPSETEDYHGHPDYLRIYLYLMGLFALSLLAAYIPHQYTAVTVIFALSTVKAILVVKYFMHLKFEPWLLIGAVLFVAFCLATFFSFVYPDIVVVPIDVVPK